MGGQLKISLSSFVLILLILLILLLACVDDDVYCGRSGRASGLVINAHELILVSWESWFRLHPDILSLSHFNLRHYLHDQALQRSLATTLRQLEYNFLYNFVATVRQLQDNNGKLFEANFGQLSDNLEPHGDYLVIINGVCLCPVDSTF